LGYGTNQTRYGAYTRLFTNKTPQYKCPKENDKFTLSVASGGTSGYGNNALTYPVGLITVDEVVYAGEHTGVINSTYHLYTNSTYWTMSPFYWNSSYTNVWNINSSGYSSGSYVYSGFGAFPSISLNFTAIVSTGNGNDTTPYIIAN
jgi:hypothetical protein